MPRARLLLVALLVACADHPSRLEVSSPTHAASGSDPWSAGSRGRDDGGFDLQSAFARIKDALAKPGRYEAPEHSADFDPQKPHWGVLTLRGRIVEREAFSLFGGTGTELHQLTERLRQLAKDPQLSGLVLRVGSLSIGMTDARELRAAMHAFRAAHKALRCHAEDASNASYLVLVACDTVGLAPLGDVAIPGPAAMPVHIKGLLDKLSIQAQFIHIGAYKGAAEPLTRDAPSREMKETLDAILDGRYQTMIDAIANERHLDPTAVRGLIDTGLFTADQAKAAKLVDEIVPFEAFRDAVHAPWTKLELDPGHEDKLHAYLQLARFLGAMPPERPTGPHVAVVYALGNIVDGKGKGILGARQEIASQTMVAALRALARDPEVKAVVLRIDSGGGSAQASELIWHAIAELEAKKPVVVSMSDVAASGGYYIASGATRIFALPNTLTGSIGVVGGRIAAASALAKLGIATYPMGRGKHATMRASLQPWTPDEQAMIQQAMQAVYTTFVGRVAQGRGKTPADIQPIAQGRVWTGAKALQLGLVDELGGLDTAVAYAKQAAHVDPASGLEVYPPAPTLRDVLVSFGQTQAPLGLGSHAQLLALVRDLDPQVAVAIEQLVELAGSFATTHVQTVALLPVLR